MRHFTIPSTAFLVFAGVMVIPIACGQRPAAPARELATQEAPADIYTCPMHPQVMEHHPGSCPICGMTLVKREFSTAEAKNSTLDLHSLLKPTNSAVISGIPVTSLQQSGESTQVEALGHVDYDTRRMQTIAAKVSGRIEKLYVKYRYQHIHKGEKIMDIYSPELVTAQQDLLFILHNDPGNTGLMGAAKTKLALLGMDDRQIVQVIQTGRPLYKVSVYSYYTGHIHEAGNMPVTPVPLTGSSPMDVTREMGELPIKEGMYVEKGQTVFQLYNTDHSWIILNLFAGSSSRVRVGAAVTITPETKPDAPFQANISYVEPFYRDNSKTLTARVYFDNTVKMLPIGSQVKATIRGIRSSGNWLPGEAVLSLGLHQVVLKKENGLFQVSLVQTGVRTGNLIQILGGLSASDSVAANAQFLMDSESFIKVKESL